LNHRRILLLTALMLVEVLPPSTRAAVEPQDGNVTQMSLPGGYQMTFTGMSVRHADGRPLQRVGIQPAVHVAPTIRGIRSGHDEVLDAALKLARGGRGR
jgi:C-terminal processing protease CtpA/Prc